MEAKHTATPWHVSDRTQAVLRICAPAGGEVAVIYDAPNPGVLGDRDSINGARQKQLENAAFIVRACNAHDDLVKVLKELIKAARLSRTSCDGRSVECELAEQILQAEEALAKAGAK